MTAGLRVDKWLFFTRLLKTRSLAAKLVETGEIRLNGTVVAKPAQSVKPGDEVMLPAGKHWRLVKVVALGSRRGPAPEAQALYKDLDAPPRDGWDG